MPILDQAMPGQVPLGAQPTADPASQPQPMDGNPADPVEQAQRSGIMAAAGEAMYSDEGLDGTLDMLEAGGDVIENAARGTAYLMHAIASSLQAQGKQLSDDALIDAGEEVLERMLTLAVEAGIAPFESQEQMAAAVEQGGAMALQVYQSLKEGAQAAPAQQAMPQQGVLPAMPAPEMMQ